MGLGKACLSAFVACLLVPGTLFCATEGTAEAARGVSLRVVVHVTLDAADLDRARDTVHGLLASAGIRSEWRDCSGVGNCNVDAPESIPVNVQLLPLTKSTDGDVCGEFMRDVRTYVRTVLIYVPPLAERAHAIRLSTDGRSNPAIATMRIGHLVGAAIAHEVGHSLGLRHGATGVMKARLDVNDVLVLRRSRLLFTPSESAHMRFTVGSGSESSDAPASRALEFFAARPADRPLDVLSALRKPPAIPAARQLALASLPSEGELQPDTEEQAKLDAFHSVLELHERDLVFAIKVIDVPQAFLGLHAGTVLMISRSALKLLSAPELQMSVAHEIGHEYFSADYERARQATDRDMLREIEHRCDAVAVLTALALDLDPGLLGRAVKKLTRFNEIVGATANAASYPTLKEREQFIQALILRRQSVPDFERNELR